MKRLWWTVCVVVILSFGQALLSSPAEAKNWTCWAKIGLVGSGAWTYTPPDWSMSGGPTADRQKRCLTHILDNWTGHGDNSNVAIWKLLAMDTANQDYWCKQKKGYFITTYGFDKRNKQWTYNQEIKTNCTCSGGEVFQ